MTKTIYTRIINKKTTSVELKSVFPSPIGELHFSILTIPATPCPVWDE